MKRVKFRQPVPIPVQRQQRAERDGRRRGGKDRPVITSVFFRQREPGAASDYRENPAEIKQIAEQYGDGRVRAQQQPGADKTGADP